MNIIWITGGKGFIGRYLARQLSEQGCKVYGIGHGEWPKENSASWGYYSWTNSDVDHDGLTQLAQVSGLPDTVYHLAGGSLVAASFNNPQKDFRSTVASTSYLLEWLRIHSPDTRIVSVSSGAVYGAGHAELISEEATISPYSPYGSHKAMMETLCHTYAENFGLNIAIVRLFSVYGAGLKKQLIWDMCKKLHAAANNKVILAGTGNELRDWLHVSDAVTLLTLMSAISNSSCPIINGGTGMGTPIKNIAELVCNTWGGDTTVEFSGESRKGDPVSLIADITKSHQLGFKPQMILSEGINDAVNWYKFRI